MMPAPNPAPLPSAETLAAEQELGRVLAEIAERLVREKKVKENA